MPNNKVYSHVICSPISRQTSSISKHQSPKCSLSSMKTGNKISTKENQWCVPLFTLFVIVLNGDLWYYKIIQMIKCQPKQLVHVISMTIHNLPTTVLSTKLTTFRSSPTQCLWEVRQCVEFGSTFGKTFVNMDTELLKSAKALIVHYQNHDRCKQNECVISSFSPR